MSDVPADMPQEDVETKSKLDLIIGKIAELWTNIQSKFTFLTNHINTKTEEINSNTNTRVENTRDEINVHTATKVEEVKALMGGGVIKSVQFVTGFIYSKRNDESISFNAINKNKSFILLNTGWQPYTDSWASDSAYITYIGSTSATIRKVRAADERANDVYFSAQIIEFY